MAESLRKKKCIPCEANVKPLTDGEIEANLSLVPDWEVAETEIKGKKVKTIQRSLCFTNFRVAMSFLREVEELAESEGHHPDFCVHYNVVDFTIWTHAIGGLHENDFIIASKIDELYQPGAWK
jgi:4a-hydroxytetrahydrobiopterin dehydratase